MLGLTWPRLRPKVVKIIGEKNTERLEFVEKYVEALITGGFHGLWEQIQQDMSGLWDMVIGGVKSWLIEKIVQQAIIKIATMWNPAGAIIQLIETAWNVYQWVKENAQRIFGLVQAVVDSMSNIVAGNIGGAANFIEASLAKLVPIAISLFADLIGLGGIADKIKGVIEKVQDTVDKAIDKLIARVMAMFKGKDGDDGKDGKTGDHSVGETITFEAAGHPHKLWFDVKGTTATLMVASTPIAVSAHLDHMTGQLDKLPADKKAGAQGLLTQAHGAEAKATAEANKATTGDGNAKDSADGKTADADEHTVAGLLKQLFELFEGLNAEDLKAACDKDGGMAKTKFGQVMAEAQPGAAGVRPSFLAGANVRLKDAPAKPLDAMRNEVSGSGDKYILKGDPVPIAEVIGQSGISRVLDLPSVFNYYLDAGYKSRLKLASADDFLAACAAGKFNPATDLNNAAEIRGKVAESWWFAKAQAGGVTLGQIKKDLTVMDTTYDKGMLRLNISASELTAANIVLHKPTAFDGLMQGWGDDPMWTAAPDSKWGLTRDGMQEGVIKASQLGVFKERVLILPSPLPAVDEVPKALTIAGMAKLDKLPATLSDEITKAASGTVIWEAPVSDPKQVTTNLLQAHPDARFDKATGTLQLPATQAAALDATTTLAALGAMIGQQTGVSKVTLNKSEDGSFTLVGSINPTHDVASGQADDGRKKAHDKFGAELFMRSELQTELGCGATKAKELVTQWIAAGILYELKSKPGDPQTRYSFDATKGGKRELDDTPSNRDKFGFQNPKKTDSNGIAILNKGLRADSPPGDHNSAAYHQAQARYDSKRPGSSYKNFGFDDAILGHKDPGCSGYWNEEGHKHSKSENQAWCKNPDNYWGPEHKDESNASGGSSPRYLYPSKDIGSHQDWWDI